MQTESARMTTAEEARLPGSIIRTPRRAPVNGGRARSPSERWSSAWHKGSWQRGTFFTAPKIEAAPKSGDRSSMKAWLSDPLAHQGSHRRDRHCRPDCNGGDAGTNAMRLP